ncbi:RES family NAD+ phosphorylase [Bosea sp. CS1GBMeth4]|uniref:RES family NAD+ phosphorylase n=1 Tax=Bosea sp. CS1GBMeth4 TaxID=1892849 RepID=UPI001644F916|nr:RES family NAD+ phosphorylase [Bosea sp. CS1GBMeth4]
MTEVTVPFAAVPSTAGVRRMGDGKAEARAAAFTSADDFLAFRREISLDRRYFRSRRSERFVRAVAASCRTRLRTIAAGSRFWRAQLGHRWSEDGDGRDRLPRPHQPERMVPLEDRAPEGRVNAKGIPCLYLATTPETAMSEVRPWIGSTITLGQFETRKALSVVDCSLVHPGQKDRTEAERREAAVWAHIDRAFSFPVLASDDVADYAATQLLAELFRCEGYDGVVYKSAFGANGFNLALFDLDSASQLGAELFEARTIRYRFAPIEKR